MFFITRIDPLGGIAAGEILVEGEARGALEDRDAILLGGTGVDCALIDDDVAVLEDLAHDLGGAQERGKIGALVGVNGRGDGDDVDCRCFEIVRVVAQRQMRGLDQFLRAYLSGGVMVVLQRLNAVRTIYDNALTELILRFGQKDKRADTTDLERLTLFLQLLGRTNERSADTNTLRFPLIIASNNE